MYMSCRPACIRCSNAKYVDCIDVHVRVKPTDYEHWAMSPLLPECKKIFEQKIATFEPKKF